LNKLKIDFVTILINLQIVQEPTQEKDVLEQTKTDPTYIGKKMSRNEPCSCGSGKKYKKCCGAL
jgi:preprotein translocase subunit SecA